MASSTIAMRAGAGRVPINTMICVPGPMPSQVVAMMPVSIVKAMPVVTDLPVTSIASTRPTERASSARNCGPGVPANSCGLSRPNRKYGAQAQHRHHGRAGHRLAPARRRRLRGERVVVLLPTGRVEEHLVGFADARLATRVGRRGVHLELPDQLLVGPRDVAGRGVLGDAKDVVVALSGCGHRCYGTGG